MSPGAVDVHMIHSVGVMDDPDLNTFAVGVAESDDDEAWGLIFQTAYTFDEQDRRLHQDRYCMSTTWGATVYGGVTRCLLDGETLTLQFESEAATTLEINPHQHLRLLVEGEAIVRLKQSLQRVFSSGSACPAQLQL